jgi:hypothetical protein
VDEFLESTGATFPIVIENTKDPDQLRQWGGSGYPTVVLIGPDGAILHNSAENKTHPNAQMIEAALKDAFPLPELPKALAAVGKAIDANKFADASKLLDKELAGTALSESDRGTATSVATWVQKRGAAAMALAKRLEAAEKWFEASDRYGFVTESFKGLPVANEAAEALKALLADPARKKEVDGGKALADAMKRAGDMKKKQVVAMFQGIAAKFKGTKAGERAAGLASKYEASK